MARKFFVNDIENPYTTDPDKPFRWIRGRQVGGRSIMWGRQCYRLSDLDFEANARDGHGVDWPIRYADIAPWYAHVEAFAGISGRAEGLPQVPRRGVPAAHADELRRGARGPARSTRPSAGTRRMTIGRTAVLTADHKGTQRLPLLRPLRARLPHPQLLQLGQRDPARGRSHRAH